MSAALSCSVVTSSSGSLPNDGEKPKTFDFVSEMQLWYDFCETYIQFSAGRGIHKSILEGCSF